MFAMCTLTVVVLLFGYHTSTSSKAAGGETAFVSTGDVGSAASAPSSAGSTSAGTAVTQSSPATQSSTVAPSTSQPTTVGSSSESTPATSPAVTSSAAPKTTSASSTTTVTGDVTDTQWGPVQVQLTVQNGKITAVSVLQYPDGNGRDQEINANALPILIQETISAQSAKIDMVSGATVTSDGYLGSLQSALDKM